MAMVATGMSRGQQFEGAGGSMERRKSTRRTAPYGRDAAPTVTPRGSELPRSASYTFIQDAKSNFPSSAVVTTYSTADVNGDDVAYESTPDSSGWTTPDEHATPGHAEQSRDIVAELHKSPKMAPHASVHTRRDSDESSLRTVRTSMDSARTKSTVATTPGSHTPRASVTSNFSRKLNRRSWTGSNGSTPAHSRSPSPPKKDPSALSCEVKLEQNNVPEKETLKDRRKSLLRNKTLSKGSKQSGSTPQSSDSEQPVARKSTIQRKSRPISGLFRSSTNEQQDKAQNDKRRQSLVPPVPRITLPQSFSTDRLPTLNSAPHSPGLTPPVPRPLTSQKSGGLALPKKKDELWSHFRTLDGEFSKFSSKSLAFKANVVRSSLLPFLRTYANHSSNRTLRPEDLDRRANILNKWWTGLIEMLHGRNNASISGTDRPAILDGIAGIMERPEWRLHPSPFCPLNLRTKGFSAPKNQSTTSLSSGQSDFLTESVHHNVRNIFVQNLSAQMAFVVDKMSLRNASASLVTFCGKACAYAFMFVPGMADVLVRLWDLQMDSLRRVLAENNIGKFDNLPQTCEHILAGFPPALQQLGFASLSKYMRKLRTPPPLPIGTQHIHWWGHWLQRWTGRDSDLFYVFVKHFHILVTDFLPEDISKDERMCAPGVLLVHAQFLTNLDATIHREANATQQDATTAGATPTFDDVLADSDAYATGLSLPPSNAIRSMVENRTVMLVREFLSERAAHHPRARRLFAESMNSLFQAAARGTSMFDHAACYTLLDLLEEGLTLLARFEHIGEHDGELLDGKFWKEVCAKMIDSQNTMTKVRLLAFIYTVWGTFVAEAGRKVDVCFGLLLDPVFFDSLFNHWCPMVRAYYMRLLCWRIGRYDGEPCVGDMEVLETLMQRLQRTWCHYLYLRMDAERKQEMLPSTIPCNPAPSRRLWIVRTDPQLNTSDNMMSFDGIMAPESKAPSLLAKRASMISTFEDIDTRSDTSRDISDTEAEPRGRGIGGFFKNLLASKSRSRSRGPPQRSSTTMSAASAPPVPNGSQRVETPMPNGLARSATDDIQAIKKTALPESKPPQHRNFSFKFSLEYQPSGKPIPAMRLVPPRLPLPAQQYIGSHSDKITPVNQLRPIEPTGASREHARYSGRALAEWQLILGECHSFFDRRKGEGVPENKFVETPALGVEVFKRPG